MRGLNVFVNIGARIGSTFGANIGAAERRFAQMGQRLRVISAETRAHMDAATRRWGSFSSNAANFATSVSAPMMGLSYLGGRTAYEFEKIGNELQGISEMSDEARRGIESVARAMPGRATYNLAAATDLARTGFTAPAIQGSLTTVVKLAQSERGMDTERAADIASNVMVGMRIPMRTVAETQRNFAMVADRIAFGAAKSSSDIRLMGESFKYAGPLATRLGITMDQLTATFMTMADAGIKGSESGVALRSMMVRMVKPTKAGVATLERLGIKLNEFVSISRKASAADVVGTMRAQGLDVSRAAPAIQRVLTDPNVSGAEAGQKITDAIVRSLGSAADAMDRDKISEGVMAALTSGADKVDLMGFVRRMIERGASTGDLLHFLDARQGARLATLFDQGVLDDRLKQVQAGAPGFLDRQYAQATKGPVGSFLRLQRSFDNLIITAARTGVLDTFADAMDRLASGMDRLSKSNPGLLRFATFSVLALAVMGPLVWTLSGIASGFRMIGFASEMAMRGLAPLFGILARGTGRMATAGLRAFAPGLLAQVRGALAGVLLRGLGPSMFAGLAGLGTFVVGGLTAAFAAVGAFLATITAPVWGVIAAVGAVLVGVGLFIARNWKGIGVFFQSFWTAFKAKLAPVKPALAEIGKVFGSLKDIFVGVISVVAAPLAWLWDMIVAGAKKVGQFVGPYLAPLATAMEPVVGAVQDAVSWFGKLLDPIALDKWAKWGTAAGNAVGAVVSRLIEFIGWLAKGINKTAEFFRTLQNKGGQVTITESGAPPKKPGTPPPPSSPRPPPPGSTMGPPRHPGRAKGGNVRGGHVYEVNEYGQELFVPGRSGTIVKAGDTQRLLTAITAIGRSRFPFSRVGRAGASVGRAPSSRRMRPVATPAPSFSVRIENHAPKSPATASAGVSGASTTAALIAALSATSPAPAVAANGAPPSGATAGERPIEIAEFHVHGVPDPRATAKAVRAELKRIAASQRGALND